MIYTRSGLYSCMVAMMCCTHVATAANPILPSTAFIPDGEPRVFEFKGEKRLFTYGSRDERVHDWCGYGHDVWSAPLDDFSEWTNHGEIFNVKQVQEAGHGRVDEQHFGAPDCVYNPVTKKYYLYTFIGQPYKLDGNEGPDKDEPGTVLGFEDRGPICVMAQSDSPAGPFVDPVMCDWLPLNVQGTFDPGVLVDEQQDGSVRVYAYWGMRGGDRCAEIDPKDMHTIIDPDTRTPDRNAWRKTLPKEWSGKHKHALFEASSIRKVADGHYVFIYSPRRPHSALRYCYGKTPFGPWTYGGDIIVNSTNWKNGNNHGSIVCVNGQWYVSYHRQTGGSISRQSMLEPIEVQIEGERVVIPRVEMTSQSWNTAGLNPFQRYNIDICCSIVGKAMISASPRQEEGLHPMKGIKSGDELGFKYFNFGEAKLKDADDVRFRLNFQRLENGVMTLQVAKPEEAHDAARRVDVVSVKLEDVLPSDGTYHDIEIPLVGLGQNQKLNSIGGLKDQLAVFLVFKGRSGKELGRIRELEFCKGDVPTPNPLMKVRVSEEIKKGRIVALPAKARFGESVKLTILPDNDFQCSSLRISDEAGNEISAERNAEVPHGPVSFHFSMPASPVLIGADFKSGVSNLGGVPE